MTRWELAAALLFAVTAQEGGEDYTTAATHGLLPAQWKQTRAQTRARTRTRTDARTRTTISPRIHERRNRN